MDEEDVYVTQLREVFESCDLTSKGYLNRSELIDLCQRLQLDDHIPALLTECVGDEVSDGKVFCTKKKFDIIYLYIALLWKVLDYLGPFNRFVLEQAV